MTLSPPTSRDGGGTEALTWVDVTGGVGFLNGWADFGAPYGPVGFAVDSTAGLVYLRGVANPGTDGVAFTLPLAARPSVQRLAQSFGDGSGQPIEVATDGTVDAFLNPTASFSFDNIIFSL